jgi:DNA helicase-2/ATP-dependent DNA helicase PcrA
LEENLPTSFSDIRYYLRCPKDYQFRHQFGFTPAIIEMFGFGKTVHTAVGKLHELFRNQAPSGDEAETIAQDVFHLKHIPPSRDPVNRPGGFERAKDSAGRIMRTYAETYSEDFLQRREVEVRFEIPVAQAVISGAIDLLIKENESGNTVESSIIDFKAMEGGAAPEEDERLDWTELALQVQLYAKATREVLEENARTGAVHLLKDNQRIQVPVTEEAVSAAIDNVTWAVNRILAGDFPMRPQGEKCIGCDFQKLCSKEPQNFATDRVPSPIHIPGGAQEQVRAFSQFDR